MWGKNSSSPKGLTNPFQSGASETTYIAAECEFSGKITLKGNARIDGLIEGSVTLTGDLVIGPSAVIKATVQAQTISISGEVRGDITATESLELCSSARLYGNIYTQQLKIDQGAKFIGSSRLLEESVVAVESETKKAVESEFESVVDQVAVSAEEPLEDPLEEILEVPEEAVNATTDSTLESVAAQSKEVGFVKSTRSKRR